MTLHSVPARVLVTLTAGLMLAAILASRFGLLSEGPPEFTPRDFVSLALACASALPVGALALRRGPATEASTSASWTIIVMLAGSLALALSMVVDPVAYNAFLLEDGMSEWVSALLVFAAAAILLPTLWRDRGADWMVRLVRIGLIVLFLLIGLEEVSWFQRQLGYTTPEWMVEANMQGEFNLHNLETNFSENLYYLGAVVLLVLGRLLLLDTKPLSLFDRLKPLVPSLPAFVAGALACAFTWDMWRIVFMQASFALAVVMCLVEARTAMRGGARRTAYLLGAIAIAIVVIQVLFLAYGASQIRMWNATEARELLIATGLLFFAAHQARRGAG